MSTTSLKLPEDVKQLALAGAQQQGISPHAFMVDAIRTAAVAAQKRASFIDVAEKARAEQLETGKGYAAADVHRYIRERAQGGAIPKPRAKSWRS